MEASVSHWLTLLSTQNRRSRIDYYGGMDKTFQRGDDGTYGTGYKVTRCFWQPRRTNFNIFILFAGGSHDR
jgi:hypothetical protein